MPKAYDFDGTVYDGDSTLDFYLHCLAHVPGVVATISGDVLDAVRFRMGLLPRQEFKERFFMRLMPRIDADEMVGRFWDSHRSKMRPWYLDRMEGDDVFLSASPDFLLRPLLEDLGIRSIIATEVDPATGRFLGPNMRGEEKVTAYRGTFGDDGPDEFYTDSLSDLPMIRISKESFLVTGPVVRRLGEDETGGKGERLE